MVSTAEYVVQVQVADAPEVQLRHTNGTQYGPRLRLRLLQEGGHLCLPQAGLLQQLVVDL